VACGGTQLGPEETSSGMGHSSSASVRNGWKADVRALRTANLFLLSLLDPTVHVNDELASPVSGRSRGR
jgi:hypothetical protein